MARVAFVISSLDLGGAQRAVSSITMALPEDWDIDIILNDDKHIVYPYKGKIVTLGVDNVSDRTNFLYQGKVFFKRIKVLKTRKKNKNYDAVISFLDSANIANILTGNKYCKNIISVRLQLSEEKSWKYRFVVNPIAKMIYKQADNIVALSEGVRLDLIRKFGAKKEKTITIYNCYDIEKITQLSKCKSEIEVNSQNFNFVTMGRLTHQKGQWHLIRAFSQLSKENENVRLYIMGIGEELSYFEDLISQYGIGDKVFLIGFVDNPFAVLNRMDVFVFPSLYEGFGNALVEAMACGLLCIASDFKSGAREILQKEYNFEEEIKKIKKEEYGIIVPVCSGQHYAADNQLEESEQQLYMAMQMMMESSELRELYARKSVERASYFSEKRATNE